MAEAGRPVLRTTLRLRDLLYQVLAQPIGLVVTTNDLERAQRALDRVRSSDPALRAIRIGRSPFALNELVLTKGPPQDEQKVNPAPGSPAYLGL